MDIEKMKLNQTMRKDAVKDAIQFKFKDAVKAYEAKLLKVVTAYVLGRKDNKANIEAYSKLSDDMKSLVRVNDAITLSDKDGNRFSLRISSAMQYLTYSQNEYYYPFMSNARDGQDYNQYIKLTFAKPLIKTDFVFDEKMPVSIKKVFDERKSLMAEIESFAHNAYHALAQVKSIKEVREYIPALEQFIPIPEKEFTKMVPYSFFNKVNKSVNL